MNIVEDTDLLIPLGISKVEYFATTVCAQTEYLTETLVGEGPFNL